MYKVRKGSLLLALALGLSLAGSAWAQPMKPMRGAANLTPEQAVRIFDLKEKFNADTVDLRRQMVVKQAELNALEKAEKPDQNAIQANKKEFQNLKDQYEEKMNAFRAELAKITPGYRKGTGEGRGMSPHMPGGQAPKDTPGPQQPAE